jgi:integrase
MLRRTFSTMNQGEGNLKSIQAQMRHSRPDTTTAIYMQVIPERQSQMVATYEAMIFGRTRGSVQ